MTLSAKTFKPQKLSIQHPQNTKKIKLKKYIILDWIKDRPPPPYGREGRLTNERPGYGHVICEPMRGFEKKYTRWRTPTDGRTWQLYDQLGPEGRVGEKWSKQSKDSFFFKSKDKCFFFVST